MSTVRFNIDEELKKLPEKPGVYIMHSDNDEIIYVGKAVILKNRVRSYFRESTKKTLKIKTMVSKIAWFEYVVTDSELEALVLENNLIKEHKPKYNTLLKDDKTYPYIKVTVNEDFPRIFMTRSIKKDNARYYGPYTSVGSVKDTIDLLCKLYKIRTCNSNIFEAVEKTGNINDACLYYHIHQCDAPCLGSVSKEEYRNNIKGALDFLNGNYNNLISKLKKEMMEASEKMDYEEAARLRDLLNSVSSIAQKQKITDTDGEDKDIIALARDDSSVIVQVFYVRNGKIIGREHYYMKNSLDETNGDIIHDFILQFYAGTPFIPRELVIAEEIEDLTLLEQWLTQKRENKVKIIIPKKGKKEKLLLLAEKNAQIVLNQDIDKIKRTKERTIGAVNELSKLIGLEGIKRMEAYDISNISGFDSVGSMVVYVDGSPKRNDYRKFRIKTVDGPDDYASMKEVLTRRFTHGLLENNEEVVKDSFSVFPDLILMDGGRGQVNIALSVLDELNLRIPVCGMVKDDNHRTRGLYYNNEEIPIGHSSEAFKLITRIQDEAHRFAIEFHKSLRSKGQVHSILDDINGIGDKRRRELMRHFDSLEAIKSAEIEELKSIPSMDAKSAEAVYNFFRKN